MKHALYVLPLCGLMVAPTAMAAPIAAGGGYSAYSGSGIASASIDHGQADRKLHAILALAREGRGLQQTDGGTLTAQHLAYLQAKLEAIRAGNY